MVFVYNYFVVFKLQCAPAVVLQGMSGPGSSGGSGGGKKAAPESNEFWWDLAGWVTLGALIFGALAFAKSAAPPPKA
jgi:hypothetical protein